jgi:superfamily II RNA helicase
MILDDFQRQAIEFINQGHSVIVAAPTGAGKTLIAEHVIDDCLGRGQRVIYTAPIKALSNQKFREFQQKTRDQVGILTGDVTLNPEAPILIMTTEIFRNKILEGGESLKKYSWVIFDEIHYLDDYERGTVWEESLIFLPGHMNVLGLSATVPNIDELAGWLETLHQRPIKVIKEDRRPVPLHFFYQCQGQIYDNVDQVIKQGFRSAQIPNFRGGERLPRFARIKPNTLSSLVSYLIAEDLLPGIYFAFSRRKTEELAREISQMNFLKPQERNQVEQIFQELCRRYDLQGEPSAYQLAPLLRNGIAYHHAGMLPTLKEVVEQLFTSRLIKIIFTTETFALGINMPARTVVFDELRKFYGEKFDVLKTRDFYQMAGRAGRRSIDTEGFVFCRVNPHFISPMELQRVIFGHTEKVNSQFNTSYATLLNLYQTFGENLYDIYPKSLHHYQVRPFLRKRAVDLLRAKVNMLKDLGYIHNRKLSPKGEFASKIFGYELILGEMHDQGYLEKLSEIELAVLVLAIVFEPRKGTRKPPLHKYIQELESVARKIKKQIHRSERKFHVGKLSKRLYFHLSLGIEAWVKGKDFGEVLRLADVDEGEVVRYFRMTIQILREILDTNISGPFRSRVQKLVPLLNRDVVDSEKQLRL